MQIQKFNVFGVNSLLHEWINVNAPGDRTYDPGNRVNIIEGMSDEGTNVIGDFPSLLTKSTWNNHIFSQGQTTSEILFGEDISSYKRYGNTKKSDYNSVAFNEIVNKGDGNMAESVARTGIASNWFKATTWDNKRSKWGLDQITDEDTLWDLFENDGTSFFIKRNYDMPTNRFKELQEAGILQGNFISGFFSDYRMSKPIKQTYTPNDENATKLCLSFWQPGRSSLTHYSEWQSGVYLIQDAFNESGLEIKRRGNGRNIIIADTEMTVVERDGKNPGEIVMQAGRPYDMTSTRLKFKAGEQGKVVCIYNR